jgi:site-specific DNA recombinase
MRAAIYTRHATDPQAQTIDQLTECHAIARRNNCEVSGTFTDVAASGTDQSRAGLAALLKKAERHEFDAVIITDLDRLSRDTCHLITFCELLRSFGVKVYTRDGELGPS